MDQTNISNKIYSGNVISLSASDMVISDDGIRTILVVGDIASHPDIRVGLKVEVCGQSIIGREEYSLKKVPHADIVNIADPGAFLRTA